MIELTWFFTTPQIKFESKRNWVELKLFKNAKSINKKNKKIKKKSQITTSKKINIKILI